MRIAAKRVSDSWSRECDVLYFVLLVFTYLLPVVLLILAVKDMLSNPLQRSRETPRKAERSVLSILIPVRNAERTIAHTLKSAVEMQFTGRKEIIVVDDGSTDRTVQICRSWGVDKVVCAGWNKKEKLKRGKAQALNRGLKQCTGSLIFVLDADTTVPRDCLRDISHMFSDPRVGGVSFPVVVEEPRNLLQRLQNIEYAMMGTVKRACTALGTGLAMSGCAMILRKDSLEAVGGFPDTLTEDVELSLRMIENGFTLEYCVSASTCVRTKTPSRLRSLIVQKYRWMSGSLESYSQHLGLLLRKPSGWLIIWTYCVYAFCIIGLLVYRSFVFLTPLAAIAFSARISPITGIAFLLGQVSLFSKNFSFIIPGLGLLYSQYLVGSSQSDDKRVSIGESVFLAPYILLYVPMLFAVTCAGVVGVAARRIQAGRRNGDG